MGGKLHLILGMMSHPKSEEQPSLIELCDLLNRKFETISNLLYLVGEHADDPKSTRRYAHQALCELEEAHSLVAAHPEPKADGLTRAS
ncbi:hypothetical protein HNQ77_000202 [Silvibacterium bohemicum]|uniref:Uncharacterized protein n=1 Tax=Silvibacterium bohemicum TaxID=1577686 RepID=A0A841JWA0_9BACT|nr:hypothetical protein [Silvibacterium bohemicum]MBB6142264.1 hypothetical protein [Silvibacterium bohemicum]